MSVTAMFHKLGGWNDCDIFMEKYSRSLVTMSRETSQVLAQDSDRDVTVSEKVTTILARPWVALNELRPADASHLKAKPGAELTLMVMNRCNFICSYCFTASLYQDSQALAPEGTVRHIDQFLRLTPARVSSLILFGGEPPLAFNAIHRTWVPVRNLFEIHQGGMPSLAIVTTAAS
jgi:sulfatase maturation enzyme AslB (radical SAM superfamily)